MAKPEDQIRSVLPGLVLQFADTYLKQTGVQALLIAGLAPLQAVLHAAFRADPTLTGMGLEIVSIRVSALTPSSELPRALQSPPFESLQQKADEAIFSRRALAVDKERAIAENELSNANARAEPTAEAAAQTIRAEADASAKIVGTGAEATRIRAVEKANADMQLTRMSAIADVPPRCCLPWLRRSLRPSCK